jgi:hypothetical protein
MDGLTKLVGELAEARAGHDAAAEKAKKLEKELYATELGQKMLGAYEYLGAVRKEKNELEARVRAASIEVFLVTQDKRPAPGILIRRNGGAIYSQNDAKDWCLAHFHDGLRLDKRPFEKAAKVMKPEFVTFTDNYTATIARDLGKALAEHDGQNVA